MTTPKRSAKTGATASKSRRTSPRSRSRKPQAAAPEPEPAAAEFAPEPPPPTVEPDPETPVEAVIVTGVPEAGFAARVLPPEPLPPRPSRRRGIFFDVENTSRAADISRVLQHLDLDWVGWSTEFTAVGNWRVIGHDTARLLAHHGAALVHSAPSVGVRDWSDLRIAVSAGVWLAGARPGDVIEIVSDDQAFDAVGDVAASLGVTFRRTSYRALAGGRAAVHEATGSEPRPHRSRRGGRRGYGERRAPEPARVPMQHASDLEPHTAPHDEIVGLVRELLAGAPAGVSLDALANALRERGFSRPPGSPRLITRLRRIKELDVSRSGTIRLVDNGADLSVPGGAAVAHDAARSVVEPSGVEQVVEGELVPEGGAAPGEPVEPAPPDGSPRRRRRRGGRRRRGRRNNAAASAEASPETA
ncbi:MAG TPA: hypothetical protein VKH82_12100 [Candidatus Binatia bacterium]|nr:hypothetical protein [Candidatus Binatia bacterium]